MRATLLRLAEDDHVLVLNTHHIISDGWSLGVLSQELAALYEAFAANRPSPLPELPIQYADYALWQREFLVRRNSGQAARLLEATSGGCSRQPGPAHGPPASADADLSRMRSEPSSSRKNLLDCLRELSRSQGATLFMTLAGGLRCAALALLRPAGRGHRHPDRRTQSRRSREADRLLRQHAGDAHRSVG